jgi:hypothetical protein
MVKRIEQEVMTLLKLLQRKVCKARVFFTADHGILWKDQHNFSVIESPGVTARSPMRYFQRGEKGCSGKVFGNPSEELFLLNYPELRRPFRTNEWGTHGGISFEESIVPFITWEVIS